VVERAWSSSLFGSVAIASIPRASSALITRQGPRLFRGATNLVGSTRPSPSRAKAAQNAVNYDGLYARPRVRPLPDALRFLNESTALGAAASGIALFFKRAASKAGKTFAKLFVTVIERFELRELNDADRRF